MDVEGELGLEDGSALLATVETFNQGFEIIFLDLHDSHLALRVFRGVRGMRRIDHDGLAKFLRIDPGGALQGSVGPSTSRILRTASTP